MSLKSASLEEIITNFVIDVDSIRKSLDAQEISFKDDRELNSFKLCEMYSYSFSKGHGSKILNHPKKRDAMFATIDILKERIAISQVTQEEMDDFMKEVHQSMKLNKSQKMKSS